MCVYPVAVAVHSSRAKVSVNVCVRVCVHVCVRVCVRVCARKYMDIDNIYMYIS